MRVALSLGTVLASGLLVPAFAQTAPPADVRQSIDGNGVDLFSGKLAIQGPVLSIGGGDTGMRYYKIYRNQGWSDNMIATMNISGTTVTVTFGGTTDRFTQSGSTYTPTEANGATLTFASNVYTYTMRDGTIAHFNKSFAGTYPFYATEGRVTDITSPNGEALTFTYQSVRYCSATKPGGGGTICSGHLNAYRLSSVKNRFGYSLSLTYPESNPDVDPDAPDSGFDVTTWSKWDSLALNNLAVPNTSVAGDGFSDNAGRHNTYRGSADGIAGIKRPGSTSEDVTYGYTSGRVTSVATAAGTTTYAASDVGGMRTVIVTNPASQPTTYAYEIAYQRLRSVKDALNRTTYYDYDPGNTTANVNKVTQPEGNYVHYQRDARGNVTETRQVSKTPGTPPDIVATAVYPASCTNVATCNQPTSTTDARGATTDYTYDPTHGGVLTVTAPMPTAGAVRPQVRYSYTQLQAYYLNGSSIVASGQPVYKLTGTSTCQVNATCAGTADEVKTTVSYGPQTAGVGNNLLPVSSSTGAGDGSLTAVTTVSYDAVGNVVSVDGPLPGSSDTTRMRYDAARQVVGMVSPDPDGAGPLKDRAVRTSYDLKGRVTLVEQGNVADQSDAAWGAFSAAQAVATTYDGIDRKLTETLSAAGGVYALTQYGYDPQLAYSCTAVRMNPATYGSLPGSACALGTAGASGDDRITRTTYDAAGEVTSVTRGYLTGAASTEASYAHTPNGLVQTVTDALNNSTTYTYTGLDRLQRTCFQTATPAACAASPADYEELTPDPNGNITSRRLRDGNSITYTYDALDRVTAKTRPALGSLNNNLSYTYDNLGRLKTATGNWTPQTVYSYDALGRMVSENDGWLGAITWQYDLGGRRTSQSWCCDGFAVTYDYLVTGEMRTIKEAGGYTLATLGYDDLGRRTSLTRGNGTTTSYGYDAVSRLASLSHDMPGTASDLALGYSYNPASQIASTTRSNDAYAWTGHSNLDRANSVNGLNQLTAVGTGALGYDARGNLATNGGVSYGYTADNQLASGAGEALVYDSLDRLYKIGSESRLLRYDGAAVSIEYDSTSGAVLRRYVHGPGVDEPLVWYEGSGTSDRRYLHADERGSIVAVTDATGNVLAKNTYDEYGVSGSGNLGRFQYTGQAWLPTLGLYYYKARMYSSRLGRFMQTDPIGYGDGMNWYNYVGSDPVNWKDPTGTLEDKMGWSCYGNCGPGYWNDAQNGQWVGNLSGVYSSNGDGSTTLTGSITYSWQSFNSVNFNLSFLNSGPAFMSFQNGDRSPNDSGGATQNPKPCSSAGDSIGSTVVDRVGDAHGSIFAAGAASASKAGNASGAQAIGRAGLPGAVALGALSEGIGAANDYRGGMSAGRSAAIHGTGFAGGLLGGFLLGEAVEPFGGGIVGAIFAGIAGSYGGSKAGEAAGAAVATAAGVCR